mmetsp:Transcript_1758/g.3870  ORF Transcript_1758/g.3870 Transcript_1758/m.3870 type:complete len:317 (-) Transcript_1758:146-1096(-)
MGFRIYIYATSILIVSTTKRAPTLELRSYVEVHYCVDMHCLCRNIMPPTNSLVLLTPHFLTEIYQNTSILLVILAGTVGTASPPTAAGRKSFEIDVVDPDAAIQQLRGRFGTLGQMQRPMATQNKLQRLEAEVVSSTQLIETSDVVMSLAVLDDEERRHDDNTQLFHQIRRPATAPALGVALVDVDLHEASLGVRGGQLGKVGVENVANSSGRAVKVHHHPLGLLGHVEELPRGIGPVLPLPDGAVNAVALGEPLGLLFGRLLHLGQATFADAVQLRIGRLEELVVGLHLLLDGRLLCLRLGQDGPGGGIAEHLIR